MERLIFDTHSHYMDDAFAEDRDAVLQALPEGCPCDAGECGCS